jgi:hypothetical protein
MTVTDERLVRELRAEPYGLNLFIKHLFCDFKQLCVYA